MKVAGYSLVNRRVFPDPTIGERPEPACTNEDRADGRRPSEAPRRLGMHDRLSRH